MDISNRRIAIFDDDEDILSICSYILEDKGWEVIPFTNCNRILEKVAEVMPAVILMDNGIPDDGGVVATQLLKKSEKFRKIPVIYFSANSNIEALAKHAGAETFLAKPFDLDELQRVILASSDNPTKK